MENRGYFKGFSSLVFSQYYSPKNRGLIEIELNSRKSLRSTFQ